MELYKKISFLFFLCFFLFPISVLGASDTDRKPKVEMTQDGKITWETIDTKATTGITWKTEGYTVKKYLVLSSKLAGTKEYGNPIYKKPYGKFVNKKEYYELKRVIDGKYYGKWTIPKDVVDTQIKNAGTTAESLEKNNGHLYLNGFFRTYHNGQVHSNYIYDLEGIKKAESWANPNDFQDHFDIPVPYHSQPVPVEIQQKEYYNGTYTTLTTKKQGTKSPYTYYIPKKESGNLWELLPANTISQYRNGKKIWLYQMQLEDIKTGQPISFPENNNYSDESVKKVTTITFQSNPITENDKYMSDINYFRNRKWDTGANGVRIVLYYKYYRPPLIPPDNEEQGDPNSKEISDDFTDPQPPHNKLEGVIGADLKGDEQFDVTQGIPTTEKTYSYVIGQEYLISYTFTNYFGTKQYQQVIPSTTPEVPPIINTVTRNYSYWKVTQLDVYEIDHATVNNYALPNERILLKPSNAYQPPNVIYRSSASMQEPTSGGTTVGNIKVQNDYLEINGTLLMKDGWQESTTPSPSRLNRPSVIDNNILFQEHMIIDRNKENGKWDSTGTLVYKNIKSIGKSQGSELEFHVEINPVIIHTPTVCDAQIQDVRTYNQLLHPDKSRAGLILDRPFLIQFPTTGLHHFYKNYGYRDYAPYIARREVSFPFDVYFNHTYIPAHTWHQISEDTTEFFLPPWVLEGAYTVQFRSIAINCDANGKELEQEKLANYDLQHYVSTDSVNVEVSGRLYNFQIYDITDYPLWQSTFRLPNSLALTGNTYKVGTYDQNGSPLTHSSKMTLPLLSGSHPTIPCAGVINTGYTFRFSLQTVGTMFRGKDSISITPKFYYLSKDGQVVEEVDLYYDETIHGVLYHLIKVGSKQDQKNLKSMYIGNPYGGVPYEELLQTANLLHLPIKTFSNVKHPIYTFSNILLPWSQRTLIGTSVPKSIQKWYGEYYLPANVHATTKGTDVFSYAVEHGIDYTESFWKTNGYLLVHFDIQTIQDGIPHLSYANTKNYPDGYCNMWRMEGYIHEKRDCYGNLFSFQDGDIVLYDLNRSVAKDYFIGGTH